MTKPGETWRVQAFAARANVTIKTLRHYDRIGLLRPARTAAGHRVYSVAHLERLRRIQALKQIGVTLAGMRALVDADAAALRAHLAATRESVARERDRLRRLEHALSVVEESLRHDAVDRVGLSRLADVLEMPRAVDHLQRYFTDEAWTVARGFYLDWPAEQWITLCRDIEAAIPDGVDGVRAAELLGRWNALARGVWQGFAANRRLLRELHEGFARAWRDRASWPAIVRRRFQDYGLDEAAAFVRAASVAEFQLEFARSEARARQGRPSRLHRVEGSRTCEPANLPPHDQ